MDEVNSTVEVLDIDYSNPAKAIEKLMQIHPVWKTSPDSEQFKQFTKSVTFADYDIL